LDCLKAKKTDVISNWKGGNNGGRATAIWLEPDACCGDKPYNSGEKSCCGDKYIFDFLFEYCQEGKVHEKI
jgi:hypothetical protein